jgi:hypothetical protein
MQSSTMATALLLVPSIFVDEWSLYQMGWLLG